LPKGIVLRIFRHGEECREESGEVVRRGMARGRWEVGRDLGGCT
jgi:hypothetical protein